MDDPRPGASDVGLEQHGEAQALRALENLIPVIQHDRAWISHAQLLEEACLKRFGLLEPPGRHRVDDGDAKSCEVREQRLGVEEHLAVTARM